MCLPHRPFSLSLFLRKIKGTDVKTSFLISEEKLLKNIKNVQKSLKTTKKSILTSFRCAQHTEAGYNTQQPPETQEH